MESFAEWLQEELSNRGWSRSIAAQRGGISASMYDKVINGYAKPGLDFCAGVARAFGIPIETVLREAGILPRLQVNIENDSAIQRILDRLRYLTIAEREEALALIEVIYRRRNTKT